VLAFRALREQPGFTAIAVVTIGLGVGANAAIFSVVGAVMPRSLAFRAVWSSSMSTHR
jgi:hypothetical protein